MQQVTLQRRDFLTLGLARELEATVSTTLTSYLGIAHCFALGLYFVFFMLHTDSKLLFSDNHPNSTVTGKLLSLQYTAYNDKCCLSNLVEFQ